jgi:hypothetical protein
MMLVPPGPLNDTSRGAGGRNAVDVGGFAAGIGHRIERSVDIQLDLRHVGDDAEPGGWAAPIMAIDVGIIAGYLPGPCSMLPITARK